MGQGILAILCSAVLYAYNLILQRQQALVAAPTEIGFFQNLTVILVLHTGPDPCRVPPLQWSRSCSLLHSWPVSTDMPWAMQGRRQVPYSVEYTAFAWAALLGWIFSENLTFTTLLGTAMIVTGCLVAAWQTGETTDASKIRPLEFVASLSDPDSPSASESGRALQIRGCYSHD